MSKSQYTVVSVYSANNIVSLRNRLVVSEVLAEPRVAKRVLLQEQEYERHQNPLQRYGVRGTPALLFLKDDRLVKRHFGEITSAELWVLLLRLGCTEAS